MKRFVFVETRVYVVEAGNQDDAQTIMNDGEGDKYLVDMDLEFKGEE